METATQVSYSFDEKYFKVLPEGRIRRRQYFGRLLGWGIIIGFMVSGITMMIGIQNGNPFSTNSFSTSKVVSLVVMVLGYYVWYILNTKRIRDIGKDPKVVQGFTIAFIVWNVLYQLYSSLGESGYIPGYVTAMEQITSSLTMMVDPTKATEIALPIYQTLIQYLSDGFSIGALLLFLYLFLMSGKSGDNEFGKDPVNTKLGLVG